MIVYILFLQCILVLGMCLPFEYYILIFKFVILFNYNYCNKNCRGKGLLVPNDTIFDTGYDVETHITISKAELSEWALYVFLRLH